MKEHNDRGVRFRYPSDWSLIDESTDDKIEVTVQSDGTAFWTLAVFAGGPEPADLVESAVAVYRADYPDADVYPAEQEAGPFGPVVTCEVEFVLFELIAAAAVRSYRVGDRSVLVLHQGSDQELETRRPVLNAMTASVRIEATDVPVWPPAFRPLDE